MKTKRQLLNQENRIRNFLAAVGTEQTICRLKIDKHLESFIRKELLIPGRRIYKKSINKKI